MKNLCNNVWKHVLNCHWNAKPRFDTNRSGLRPYLAHFIHLLKWIVNHSFIYIEVIHRVQNTGTWMVLETIAKLCSCLVLYICVLLFRACIHHRVLVVELEWLMFPRKSIFSLFLCMFVFCGWCCWERR